MLNNVGKTATLIIRNGVTQDDYGNDVPNIASVELENVFVYADNGSVRGDEGGYLSVSTDATALLPIGTADLLDTELGTHSLAGAVLMQDGSRWEVQGDPIPYPSGTSPFSWDWKLNLKAATG